MSGPAKKLSANVRGESPSPTGGIQHPRAESPQIANGFGRERQSEMELTAHRCAENIRQLAGKKGVPAFALVLGSGFQGIVSALKIEAEIGFDQLPGFPTLAVQGHAGRLFLVNLGGFRMVICAGRAHYYEGHEMETVMFPTRVLAACGVEEVVFTNAAGGINRRYQPGDLMLFRDHINHIGVNPLRGFPAQDGKCFVDLSDTYCRRLRKEFKMAARTEEITLREGVYIGVSGPAYETPAEIRAFRHWGADAVGMSTIPEVLMARYCGMSVAAISCITNFAAGMRRDKLSHREVLKAGRDHASNALRMIEGFAEKRLARERRERERI